jgi:transposase-like protein
MDILINENNKAQCPNCGMFNDIEYDKNLDCYMFRCSDCRRSFSIFISKKEFENVNFNED